MYQYYNPIPFTSYNYTTFLLTGKQLCPSTQSSYSVLLIKCNLCSIQAIFTCKVDLRPNHQECGLTSYAIEVSTKLLSVLNLSIPHRKVDQPKT